MPSVILNHLFRLFDRDPADFLRSFFGLLGGVFLGVGVGVLGLRLNLGGGPTKQAGHINRVLRRGKGDNKGTYRSSLTLLCNAI